MGETAAKARTALLRVLPDAISQHWDAFENVITGLGTISRDKRTQLRHRRNRRLTDDELDSMYHDADLVSTIIDSIPDESMREGFSVKIEAEDTETGDPETDDSERRGTDDDGETDGSAEEAIEQSEAVRSRMDDFNTEAKFNEAWRWGRLFGGGGLYMGIEDGAVEQEEELREENIQKITFLQVLDKRDFTPLEFFDQPEDVDDPRFGEPKIYLIHRISDNGISGNQFGIRVHASRLIIFPGARTSRRKRRENQGWDQSVIQRLNDTLNDSEQSWGSVAHLMTDINQGVVKIKGLIEMIAGGNKQVLQDRMEIMDYGRSVVRALMLDADGEDFERKATNLAGIADILDRFMMRLSSASGIPVTILFGRSPAGQNATGDADFRSFFNRIRAAQKLILKPRLQRWAELIMLEKGGATGGKLPDRWSIEFTELWTPTPLEEETVRKLVADRDLIYMREGVLKPEDVAASRFRPEGYSRETIISEDPEDLEEQETPEQMELRMREEMTSEADTRELEQFRMGRPPPAAPEPPPEPPPEE